MNETVFSSMREQLRPSEAARAALWERLEAESIPQNKEMKRIKQWKPMALAACAALILCAYPAYNALKPQSEPRLHSYVTLEAGDPAIKGEYRQETTAQGVDQGAGDRDQVMRPGEVVEAMEEAGFSTADIDAYQTLGYEMTWAKWWKYVDSRETLDLESLKSFSDKELGVNTGDLPGGAYIGDVPVQLGADAYQLLMDHFGGDLPDWYGGAYVTETGSLMILLVEDQDPGDKTLELEVLEAVGDLPVGFTSAKYSRNDLGRMNDEIGALLDGKGIFATWGIYDDQNRIILDVSEPLPDDLLTAIGALDPADDAILIRVIQGSAVVTPDLMKGPDPIGESADPVPGGVTAPNVDTADQKEGEDPAPHFATEAPNDIPVPDEDLEAIEPYYDGGISDLPDKLPGKVEPAHYDLLPLEE